MEKSKMKEFSEVAEIARVAQVSFIRPLFENVLSPLRAKLCVFIFALVL